MQGSETSLRSARTAGAPSESCEDTMHRTFTPSIFHIASLAAFVGLGGCAATGADGGQDVLSLGAIGGKADGASRACVELQGAEALAAGESRSFSVRAASLLASVHVEEGGPARLAVGGIQGEADARRPFVHARFDAIGDRVLVVENVGEAGALSGTLCITSIDVEGVSPELYAAALRNLDYVAKEIDERHLREYGLGTDADERSVPVADQFLHALLREYAGHPEVLAARLRSLASMVFFAAPEVTPPEEGHATPFHGLDMSDFEELMRIEDSVWRRHTSANGGSKDGVRPFSVCETRYMIDEYVRRDRSYDDWESYRAGFESYREGCPEEDLLDWYNFRGLGHLRPSWDESNIMERVVRRMVSECDGDEVDEEWRAECAEWERDRLGYREQVNRELASRFMFYDVETQEEHLADPNDKLVLLEDRTGDGVGELIRNGTYRLSADPETEVEVEIESTGRFSGRLRARMPDGTMENIAANDVVLETAVNPAFDPTWWERPDFGLTALFEDGSGCTEASPSPSSCALLQRFYVLIDRHENFYDTYSSLQPTCRGSHWCLSSQPSPLVACSVTLRAAHHWDDAGIPEGGNAGFIFLMRIPFRQILTGSSANVSTLEPPPRVLTVQDIYAGEELDMSRVWLDIATLSNDLYSSENEISKFGSVPAEQIEGILVVRRPANMDPSEPSGGGGSADGGVGEGQDAGMLGDGGM